ncbi:MAG: hypothetical protein U0U67_09935 [Chitinophagales bacterium]
MNKGIAQYSALAAVVSLVFPIACTEDKEPVITDNIQDSVFNKTYTAIGTAADYTIQDSLDINADGKADFNFFIDGGTYGAATFASCNVDMLNGSGNILTSPQTFDGLPIPVAIAQADSAAINAASTNFTDICYFADKYNSDIVGFAGAGDKYVGFRFKASDGTHYGWMKLNLSADYRSITVKDVAYDKRANTQILVGAK